MCSSRWICWLRVGWAMNNCSAARVNVPASATATKYRKCRSSTPSGARPPEPDETADPATVCVIPVTRITLLAFRGKRTPLMLRPRCWATLESTDSPHPPAVSGATRCNHLRIYSHGGLRRSWGRAHDGGELDSRGDAELGEDPVQVIADGPMRQI